MTKAQYLAMGTSPAVAEVLSASDRELAMVHRRLMRQIAERALQDKDRQLSQPQRDEP